MNQADVPTSQHQSRSDDATARIAEKTKKNRPKKGDERNRPKN